MTTVLLFDIDGTLVLTGGAGLRAMARAFHELFDIPDAFRGIPMPGRTDALILADAALAHGIGADELTRFREVYLGHLAEEIQKPGPRKGVMPGIRTLLDALASRDDVFLALLTGNFEPAARVKLEYFGLWEYFRCGAFGDGAPDRNRLLPEALARVRDCGVPIIKPSDAVVVGDTPLDVACAVAGGARCVAVATGSHTVDELSAAGADVVLQDLSDTHEVLRLLQLAERV